MTGRKDGKAILPEATSVPQLSTQPRTSDDLLTSETGHRGRLRFPRKGMAVAEAAHSHQGDKSPMEESAAMSQANTQNSCLSPKRRLGSFHLLRNLR